MLGPAELLLVAASAVAAGAVNALAGGGTLITFPVLLAVGLPAVAANVTNTVALCPGHISSMFAQRASLRGQSALLWKLLPAGAVGGLLGGVLLLGTGERAFRQAVPFLLLAASIILALQERVRAWLLRRAERRGLDGGHAGWAPVVVSVASVYGGYFGAGLGVILLASLGAVLDDSLSRLNAIKQSISLVVNVAAAVFFLFSGQIVWSAAAVMAAGALVGGTVGGRLANRVSSEVLRRIVVGIGVVLSFVYLMR
ncbi:MAG: sulfite exporter TauE/SafE family protein [Deltaproteobacteria bacterium]|nr:sulfite exporter TauE/SafE family protein [Deltaproteobacteria bacterium]